MGSALRLGHIAFVLCKQSRMPEKSMWQNWKDGAAEAQTGSCMPKVTELITLGEVL